MEASLHPESLKTSANDTISITSLPSRSICVLTDRLNDLWIPWRELWKKVRATPTEKALQQFLQVYRITPNNKTPVSQSPAEVMFARIIRSVYNKLLPKQTKHGRINIVPTKRYNPGEKVSFRIFNDNKYFGKWYDREKSWEYDVHCKGSTIHV